MKRYFKIWLMLTANSVQSVIATRIGVLVFTFGKLFRVALYLAFVKSLFSQAKGLAGFSESQALLFLITYIFLASAGQMFFREVYRFRPKVVSGEFDFFLARPIHPLLQNLLGGFDVLDLFTMPMIVFALVKIIGLFMFNLDSLFLYMFMCLNSFLIIMSIHIVILSSIIFNDEVDNGVMVYRDIEGMARLPIDIYKEPLRQILTFLIPLGVMFTFPAKAFLGMLSVQFVFIAFVVGVVSLILSFKLWNKAIKKYSSASS